MCLSIECQRIFLSYVLFTSSISFPSWFCYIIRTYQCRQNLRQKTTFTEERTLKAWRFRYLIHSTPALFHCFVESKNQNQNQKLKKWTFFFLQTPGHPHSHPKDHRADVSLLGSLLKISPFGPLKPWTLMKRLMIKN